jgi:hypothetical protein
MSNEHRTYRIQHGGETLENVAFAAVGKALEALVAKYGAPPAPVVVETTPVQEVVAEVIQAPAVPIQVTAVVSYSPSIGRGVGNVDAAGKARSEADRRACIVAGFAPENTLYARGTRVIEVGVDNARLARSEYDAKPSVGEACDELRQTIADERRADVVVDQTTVFMNSAGVLLVGPDKRKLNVDMGAFRQLCGKLGLPPGAGQYLSECWPELRARNVNNWTALAKENAALAYAEAQAAQKKYEPETVVLRTRRNAAVVEPVVFAVVSEEYCEFDADKFAQAIQLAVPQDAKCQVTYDGRRAKIEVLFHSTTKPEDYVCGEFFRAAMIMRTDDTGRGGLRGYSAVEQNLCLNLIITSKDAQPVFQVTHRSDVQTIARKIKEGLKKSEAMLSHFLAQWGYARHDDLAAQARARGELYEGMGMSEIFAALANGAIERELVPVRGRRDVVVPALMRAWEGDTSGDGPSAGTITRAGLVNAFTSWAHKDNDDSWFTDKAEVGAASLLWPASDRQRLPPVIPAIPLSL